MSLTVKTLKEHIQHMEDDELVLLQDDNKPDKLGIYPHKIETCVVTQCCPTFKPPCKQLSIYFKPHELDDCEKISLCYELKEQKKQMELEL